MEFKGQAFSRIPYPSKIRESLMMESPEEAIERLYREMQRKVGR